MGYFISSIISISFDPLSVFFLTVIALVSLPSALYAIGYLKGHYSPAKIIYGWALFIVFVISMALVVTANNALFFIVVWEVMSLVSYFLVVFDSENEKSVKAGTIYIVMTHIGTACIIGGILAIFKYSNSFDLMIMKEACLHIPSPEKNIIFLLFLIGFGTKAGMVPLHIWLPYAHPQAPSHVSSLMSGVMIKTAVYGIIRFVIMTLGVDSVWWGSVILVMASVSCLVGVIYALIEHDIKRLLAYHSVENIGIILLGVGASMVFTKMNLPILAALALVAGLYHLINHALFKGLLFLCAGSVYKATGKRNMEKLGGLIKTMPWTAGAFLAGAMAISALPPLNGLVSEWLTLQTFFLGALSTTAGIKIFMGMLAGVLALTGGLAAACFVKAFGITFLAMPRSKYASEAKESPVSMRIAMIFLAALTVIFGIAAPVVIRALSGVVACVNAIDASSLHFTTNNFIITPSASGGIFLSPFLAGVILIVIVGVIFFASRFLLRKARVTKGKTWDCGYYSLTPRTEYTATAFSKPFRIAFNFFLLPYRKTEKIRESFYHVKYFKYELYTTPIFKQYMYKPVLGSVMRIAGKLKKLQAGSIHLYISYIFITMLVLIIFMNRF